MKNILRYLWENEDGFFGIGIGPSSGEKKEAGSLGSLAGFATGEGEGDISASDNFFKSILSGDPGQISKVLGGAISGINKRGQEEKKTNAEFGNRGGGTNASNQLIGDKSRSAVDNLVGNLTSGAASALGSQGSGLVNTGASAHEGSFSEEETLHKQQSDKWNDIFKSISAVASSVLTGGVGGVGGIGGDASGAGAIG